MSNHTTKNEIEFIRNLGKHNIHNEYYSGPGDKAYFVMPNVIAQGREHSERPAGAEG